MKIPQIVIKDNYKSFNEEEMQEKIMKNIIRLFERELSRATC